MMKLKELHSSSPGQLYLIKIVDTGRKWAAF